MRVDEVKDLFGMVIMERTEAPGEFIIRTLVVSKNTSEIINSSMDFVPV